MKQQQVIYALERLQQLFRQADYKISSKHTKKVIIRQERTSRNEKAYLRDRKALQALYDAARDEVVLGDEAKALSLIKAFAAQF